jgi:hypothetical protein
MPMTPPMTPEVVAFSAPTVGAMEVDEPASYQHELEERVVLLYVGRM